MAIEHKDINFEIKHIDEKGIFKAHASTWDDPDLADDTIIKGAFLKSLGSKSIKDIFMFWQHKNDVIIGEWVEIKEDSHGLFVEGRLFVDDIQKAQEAYFLMKKGIIRKLSIGFRLIKKSFHNGMRVLEEIDLKEISIVTNPCNPNANITSVKNMKDLTIRDYEAKLRDELGFSNKEAKALAVNGFKGLKGQDDADDYEKNIDAQEWAEIVKLLKGK